MLQLLRKVEVCIRCQDTRTGNTSVSFISPLPAGSTGVRLVVGALYARELAKKVKAVDYRLLIAAAYSGPCMAWRTFLSIGLHCYNNFRPANDHGAVTEVIPTSQTIFAP